MLSQFHYTNRRLPLQLINCLKTIEPLYEKFISSDFRRRRNVNHAKLNDVEVIALLCFQVLLGITTRTRFYRFIVNNQIIDPKMMPEESRFNRICNRDGLMLQIIRYELVRRKVNPKYTIMDSLPMPLCKSVRKYRSTTLNQYANIGFNSTKQTKYYGFKGSFQVSDQGIVVSYNISKASVHDINLVKPLIDEYYNPKILADQGYLSQKLKVYLAKRGIKLWTPRRSNMKQYPYDDRYLKRLRRYIETVFSGLNRLFDIEHNSGKSIIGYHARIEQCLLVDTLSKLNMMN